MNAITRTPMRQAAAQEFETLGKRVNGATPDFALSQVKALHREVNEASWLTLNQKLWLNMRLRVTTDNVLWDIETDYVGPVRPTGILVGDTPGTKLPSFGAFTPWSNGCGLHLMGAMDDVGINILSVGIVNSAGANLVQLLDALGRSTRIIALGKQAAHRLDEQGLYIHGYVNHPQFEKRFRGRGRKEYGTQIKEGLTAWKKGSV